MGSMEYELDTYSKQDFHFPTCSHFLCISPRWSPHTNITVRHPNVGREPFLLNQVLVIPKLFHATTGFSSLSSGRAPGGQNLNTGMMLFECQSSGRPRPCASHAPIIRGQSLGYLEQLEHDFRLDCIVLGINSNLPKSQYVRQYCPVIWSMIVYFVSYVSGESGPRDVDTTRRKFDSTMYPLTQRNNKIW